MTSIGDWDDARKTFGQWKKEHPDEKVDTTGFKQDPLQFKRFLESKGFHFDLTDSEWLEQYRRLQLSYWDRFILSIKDSLTLYSGLSRRQRSRLMLWFALFGIGFFCLVFAVFFIGQVSPLLFQSRNYSDPKVLKNTLDLVYVLLVITFVGEAFVICVMCWTLSNMVYSWYLEGRIHVLEKGLTSGQEPDKTQDHK